MLTPQQIAEARQKLGIPDTGISTTEPTGVSLLAQLRSSSQASTAEPEKRNFAQKVGGFFGIEKLGLGLRQAVQSGFRTDAVEGNLQTLIDTQSNLLEQIKKSESEGKDTSRLKQELVSISADIENAGKGAEKALNPNDLTGKEIVGSAVNAATLMLPIGKSASLAGKVAKGAGTGYALDVGTNLQEEDKTVGEAFKPGIGTALGAGFPVLGKLAAPVGRVIGNLTRNLASGLSGGSAKGFEAIMQPGGAKAAKSAVDEIFTSGQEALLKKNAETYMNGVSKIRQEARSAYAKGLEELSKTDIKPEVFREKTQAVLDKYGSQLKNGRRTLTNVEFNDPKNITKASDLIDKLHNAVLDGKSLRKLSDDIESAAYKIATSDERLSFNAFIKDLSANLKTAVTSSTGKLDEINKAFTTDMQLAEGVQRILGKVKFKNVSELNTVAKQLESLFNKEGLDPKTIDDFLTRIGVDPVEFKASEAARQIGNIDTAANSQGTNFGEVLRMVTSAVVTPKTVRDSAIKLGMSQDALQKVLGKLPDNTREIFLKILISGAEKL